MRIVLCWYRYLDTSMNIGYWCIYWVILHYLLHGLIVEGYLWMYFKSSFFHGYLEFVMGYIFVICVLVFAKIRKIGANDITEKNMSRKKNDLKYVWNKYNLFEDWEVQRVGDGVYDGALVVLMIFGVYHWDPESCWCMWYKHFF